MRFAAKMLKRRNPINYVGVTEVYGIDNPQSYQCEELVFVKEHTMIPQKYINELRGFERLVLQNFMQEISRKSYIAYLNTKRNKCKFSIGYSIKQIHDCRDDVRTIHQSLIPVYDYRG